GLFDQERLERLEPSVSPQEGQQEFFGVLGGQRINLQLRVGALVLPVVLILGAVVDQQEETSCRQALKQAIEDCLGPGIDPVEILEDETEGLALALQKQQALDGIQGPLATLRWIEGLPLRVLDGHP